MTDTGIAGDATRRAAHPRDAEAADGTRASRPRRRRLPQGGVALVVALVVAIGGLVAIVAFLAPLASAAGGCGGG
jgi:ferric-dicitrate binding protein FerR (iron transport regulator)